MTDSALHVAQKPAEHRRWLIWRDGAVMATARLAFPAVHAAEHLVQVSM